MTKVVVLGGTGMAGHVVATYLEEQGYDVYITSRSAVNSEKSKAIDVTNIPVLTEWLDAVQPEVIINCIGILQKVSEERPDLATLVNSYLPQYLAHKYSISKTKLIHLSTDCVFSGKRGGYTETDIPDGATIYDRSKALGEINNKKDLTFRMSIIGPDRHENGTGLFNWFMKQSGTINGYSKVFWNGVTTIELARAMGAAIKQNLTGLYHLVPDSKIDKYHLLLLFKEVFKRDDIEVIPFDGVSVDKSLVNTRSDFDFEVRDYPRQVADMCEWTNTHKSNYLF
ncbi:SDR family oxidoreductase [Ruminococcaceae bacterium OttesenSCG-928-L11]|nr:SDR family oxidoreductase [Ruminococcaceae bacterium OttesenSCG-928-L11]